MSVQDCERPHEDHGHGGRHVDQDRDFTAVHLADCVRKALVRLAQGLISEVEWVIINPVHDICIQTYVMRGHIRPYKEQLEYHPPFVCESLWSSMIETSVFSCVTYFRMCVAGQHKHRAWVHETRDLFLKLAKHNNSGISKSQTVAAIRHAQL